MKFVFTMLAITGLAFAWQFSFADSAKDASATGSTAKCSAGACGAGATGAVASTAVACSADTECAEKCCSEKCASECKATECAEKCSAEKCCAEKCSTEKCASKCSGSKCASKCSGSECSSECAKKCDSACDGEKSACCATLAKAKERLPKMTYQVGEESVCCSQMAAELAEKHNQKVQFVVAEKTYCCKEAAFTALVEETEKFVKTFVTPSQCQASGSTSVAGKAFTCSEAAGKQTQLVSTAVKAVRMGYKVGDEEVCCIKHAGTLAKETGAPIEYIVDGESTQCELTARLKVATAQYMAAVAAITAAESSDNDTASLSTNGADEASDS
jgi:hypothetical protein